MPLKQSILSSNKLPKLSELVYDHPNPDGSRKVCKNCVLFVKSGGCAIHDKNLSVHPTQVCGYHVYGKPMDRWPDYPNLQPVDPKYSGLVYTKEGTSCDICKAYDKGYCRAVSGPNKVEPKGCCSRWTPIK